MQCEIVNDEEHIYKEKGLDLNNEWGGVEVELNI